MPRLSPLSAVRLALLAPAALGLALAPASDDDPPPLRLGAGAHTYEWVDDWFALPDGEELGLTNGSFAFDASGAVYFNTDTERAVVVVDPDGALREARGKELVGGLHGMTHAVVDGREVLLLTHTAQGRVLMTTLDGEVLREAGPPADADLYGEGGGAYRPTAVALAPDGHLYVADGYGTSWIHEFDEQWRWVRRFGGPGDGPTQVRTPHGICVDERGEEPRLVVADRENGRLQVYALGGEHVATYADDVRRPCSVFVRGDDLVVADLNGRVTILDEDFELVAHLGDNPDEGEWSNVGVPRDRWRRGVFTAPHHAAWDANGDLYVLTWSSTGRVSKLRRVPTEEDPDG